MTRRDALKTTALATAALSALPTGSLLAQTNPPFTLDPLPYAADALEPHIDARTMEIHHDKHHGAYVANLNKALASAPEAAGKSLEAMLKSLDALPEGIRTAVRNNGGGHYNHSLFWQMMKKNGGGEPKGDLAQAIDKHFHSFSSFKEKFTETAMKTFGSGWAWLVLQDGALTIESTPNQDTPISSGAKVPLLGIDVWEHAYYLRYQNRRPDYIAAWFQVVNWDFVARRFAKGA
jgi:Fe-Mn family superoxide dismutase